MFARKTLLAALAAGLCFSGAAVAQIKVGLILPMSGQQASTGKQIDAAVKLYMAQHGTTVAGKKIEVIVKDDGAVPDNTKRIAQELIVNDKVSFIAGFGVTPAALAAAPLANPDFAPFLQRARDASPEAIFVFVPSGQGGTFAKQYAERGLDKAGIKLIGPGDVTDDDLLNGMGDAVLGAVTAHLYSAAHSSKMNQDFVAAFRKMHNGLRPNFMAVGGYDGMHLIFEALKKTNGNTDGDAVIAAMKGMKWESPRGPISIDPETRDIVQNIYIRKVEKVGGELYNVEFATFEAVKDPAKEAAKKK